MDQQKKKLSTTKFY